MKHRIFGIACFFYVGIISYFYITHRMGNYLVPNMQMYLWISVPVLFLIGVTLLFSKEKEKISIMSIVLLFPVLFFFLSGDGKLTTNFAYNRNQAFSINQSGEKKQKKNKTKQEEITINEDMDFKDVDFSVVDESYVGLSEGITYSRNPEKLVGKTIRVRGFSLKKSPFIPKEYFGLGKYVISCCAADASFVGYIVKADDMASIKDNTWYEIEGVLDIGEDSYGQTIVIIRLVHYKKISSKKEKQYVYPCYAYGDGSCKEVVKYHLN